MTRPRVPAHLHQLLEHVRRVVDPQRQAQIDQLHSDALSWKPVPRLPLVITFTQTDSLPFAPLPHAQIFNDPAAMLYNELVHAFGTSIAARGLVDDDLPCTVRANFGIVIVPSLFGARAEQVADNPPWIAHDTGGGVSLEELVNHGPPALDGGWMPRVIETLSYYRDVLALYPPLDRIIRIIMSDLQSPFDNLELIVGSGLFAELYEKPQLVEKALDLVTQTQIDVANKLLPLITDGPEGFCHQHAMTLPGRILLRNDSVIMMSPDMYVQQIAPYDQRVLQALGGGGIHSCGRIDPYVESLISVPSLRCIDLGQAPMNDLDTMYAKARQRRIALIRVDVDEEAITTGCVLDRFPTGVSLRHEVPTLADAKRLFEAYIAAV
ncbi:MAG: hypothetical protein IT445_15025 [Phycisphaeraceae bacterium]|nr:hypothetical protein [Phycisphaeraceae bacterium]